MEQSKGQQCLSLWKLHSRNKQAIYQMVRPLEEKQLVENSELLCWGCYFVIRGGQRSLKWHLNKHQRKRGWTVHLPGGRAFQGAEHSKVLKWNGAAMFQKQQSRDARSLEKRTKRSILVSCLFLWSNILTKSNSGEKWSIWLAAPGYHYGEVTSSGPLDSHTTSTVKNREKLYGCGTHL